MLVVIQPFTFVASAVVVDIDSMSGGFVLFPFAVVDITIDVGELAFPFGFIVEPLAFVLGSIRPDLYSKSFTNVTPPLTVIDNSIFELDRLPFLNLVVTRGRFRGSIKFGICFHFDIGSEVLFILFGQTGATT